MFVIAVRIVGMCLYGCILIKQVGLIRATTVSLKQMYVNAVRCRWEGGGTNLRLGCTGCLLLTAAFNC